MSTYRRWQTRPSPGKMVSHPSVLLEARRDYNGVRPEKRSVDGLTIVTYSRPRVYLDREAWEMLPPDGVLLMRVRPTGGQRFALAFTAHELEQTFGEVKQSESWEVARCYHFPREPPAARAFLVRPTTDARAGASDDSPLLIWGMGSGGGHGRSSVVRGMSSAEGAAGMAGARRAVRSSYVKLSC
jgi:hypothetical protein